MRLEGLAPDDEAASRWIIARAEEGVPAARLFAGMLLAGGTGTAQDLRAGRKWLEKAQADYPDDAKMFIGVLDSVAQEQEGDLPP
jgi:TPR repeat protein